MIKYLNVVGGLAILLICAIGCESPSRSLMTADAGVEGQPPRGTAHAAEIGNEMADVVESTFDDRDVDGWTMRLGGIRWARSELASDESLGGHAESAPRFDGRTAYFVAPSKFHRDWTPHSALRIRLRSTGGKYYNSGYGMDGDVLISSGKLTARCRFNRRPSADWDTLDVPLSDSGNWILGGGAKSVDEVLGRVTDLQIRAEYGGKGDSSSLDAVQLMPLNKDQIAAMGGGDTLANPMTTALPPVGSEPAVSPGGVPEALTSEAISAMTRSEALDRLTRIRTAGMTARAAGDAALEVRLRREWNLLVHRLREISTGG